MLNEEKNWNLLYGVIIYDATCTTFRCRFHLTQRETVGRDSKVE